MDSDGRRNPEKRKSDETDWICTRVAELQPGPSTPRPRKSPRLSHAPFSGLETEARRESAAKSQKRNSSYQSTFIVADKTKLVENFSQVLEENRLHEALGFFDSRRRVPPVIYNKSSVVINVRSENELIPLELVAFSKELETALNRLSPGDPVQFFFIHRRSAKQLVFVRPLERDDPVCKLHRMSLAASGPLFPLNTSF